MTTVFWLMFCSGCNEVFALDKEPAAAKGRGWVCPKCNGEGCWGAWCIPITSEHLRQLNLQTLSTLELELEEILGVGDGDGKTNK
jgi:hypothetical protein